MGELADVVVRDEDDVGATREHEHAGRGIVRQRINERVQFLDHRRVEEIAGRLTIVAMRTGPSRRVRRYL